MNRRTSMLAIVGAGLAALAEGAAIQSPTDHPQMTQMNADEQKVGVGGCVPYAGARLGENAESQENTAREGASSTTRLRSAGPAKSGQPPTLLHAVAPAPAERAAVEAVESGGDPRAHNEAEDARGVIQIRAIYVADANRILGEERFTHQDAFDPAKAWEMFEVVTSHYIRAYGYADTFEVRCRIHNGGPRGPTKSSTLTYWRKIKEAKG